MKRRRVTLDDIIANPAIVGSLSVDEIIRLCAEWKVVDSAIKKRLLASLEEPKPPDKRGKTKD
jgi:hypothetical protein